MTELAAALGVLCSLDNGQPVIDAVLLATHDLLYTKAPRHLGDHLMRKLAEVLVSPHGLQERQRSVPCGLVTRSGSTGVYRGAGTE